MKKSSRKTNAAATAFYQILQDQGIIKADQMLNLIAGQLGTEVVSLRCRARNIPQEVLELIPANTARMYQCIPVSVSNGTLRVAFADPFNPARVDELGFIVKKDIHPVIADPSEIQKVIDRSYGEDSAEDVEDLLKELGQDEEIAKEVEQVKATDDEAIMAQLADAAPIVRFVNLVLFQAIKDRAHPIFTSNLLRRNSASATVSMARFMKCRHHPSIWRCRSFPG